MGNEGDTMSKKPRLLIRGPALSASGYGEHCRFLIRSLLKNPLCDLYIDNIKWGNLGFDLSVYDEIPELKDRINKTKQLLSNPKAFFDISVQTLRISCITASPAFFPFEIMQLSRKLFICDCSSRSTSAFAFERASFCFCRAISAAV